LPDGVCSNPIGQARRLRDLIPAFMRGGSRRRIRLPDHFEALTSSRRLFHRKTGRASVLRSFQKLLDSKYRFFAPVIVKHCDVTLSFFQSHAISKP